MTGPAPAIDPDKACRFLDILPGGSGSYLGKRIGLRDWQASIVRRLLEFDPATGRRRYREAYIQLPRGNGKTELAAGLALLWLAMDPEPGGEIYAVAVDRDQANLLAGSALSKVQNSPALLKRLKPLKSHRRIVHRDAARGSFLAAIPSDEAGSEGMRPSLVIADETHAWPKRGMYDVLKGGMGKRAEPMWVTISTSGVDQETIGGELYRYARSVRDGEIDDPGFLPIIYEAPEDADPFDEDLWHQVNPALGDFLSLEHIRAAAARAKAIPRQLPKFRQYHLNQWVEGADSWLPLPDWDAGRTTIDEAGLRGRPCWAGLDLSQTTDLTACVLIFPDDAALAWMRQAATAEDLPTDMGTITVLPHFWIPEDCDLVLKERRDGVPYRALARQGRITITPGATVDQTAVRAHVVQAAANYDLREVGYDPWGAAMLAAVLRDREGITMTQVRQGVFTMSPACKHLEGLVASGSVRHGGHPILRRHVERTRVKTDESGNVRPVKGGTARERIDGVVALITGLAAMLTADPPAPPSIYETMGATSGDQ